MLSSSSMQPFLAGTRYLNMKAHGFDDSKKNYTSKFLNIDNNSESFFRQQFNLKYYGAPIEFLEEVHQKYFDMVTKEDRDLATNIEPKNS